LQTAQSAQEKAAEQLQASSVKLQRSHEDADRVISKLGEKEMEIMRLRDQVAEVASLQKQVGVPRQRSTF
jgi:hypothetical protein